MENKKLSPLFTVLLLMIGICMGLYINKGVGTQQKVNIDGGSKFDEVMWYVDNDYVDVPDHQQLQDEAIAALMEGLDPHSAYVSLDEFNDMNDPLLGSFDGIGVQFRMEEDSIAIVSVIKGGPCEKVGLLAVDRIVYVDDTLVAGQKLTNDDVMRKLKGPKNTKVRVKVLRRGVEGMLDYTITRDAIPTYSIAIAYMLDDHTGYIKLSKFSATTGQEFRFQLEGFDDVIYTGSVSAKQTSGSDTLIVIEITDPIGPLIYQRSGWITIGTDMEGLYVPSGALIYENGQSGVMRIDNDGFATFVPVQVLSSDDNGVLVQSVVTGALLSGNRVLVY